MSESIDFIKKRAASTIAAAGQLAGQWTWQGKTLAEMKTAQAAIIGDHSATPPSAGQEVATSAAEKEMKDSRETWDDALGRLHRRTMQGVSMAKTRYKNDPVKLSLVSKLTARGDSRPAIMEEALELETAWTQVEPTWSPLPANTLTAFKTLREECLQTLQTDYLKKLSIFREQAGDLAELGDTLNQIGVSWYSDATDVFPAGTPEGDMIRGTIPTTYSPAKVTTPVPKPA